MTPEPETSQNQPNVLMTYLQTFEVARLETLV